MLIRLELTSIIISWVVLGIVAIIKAQYFNREFKATISECLLITALGGSFIWVGTSIIAFILTLIWTAP